MKRKNILTVIVTLLMLCLSMFAVVGCSKQPITLGSVTITNKTELTAEWHLGDADRTVVIAFAPDSFTADNTSVVLTSDNRDAVVVDGMALKAVGLGKAKITATADGKTDTVDVEVTPKLTGIAITNKNVLTSVWFIGDDTRMVEVKLSPDNFTIDNTDVQITSSNPQAVKAEGATLTALAEGTATITAKAGEFSDTVNVTVSVPELTGISINEADLKKPWTVGDADREVVVTYDPAGVYNEKNTPYTITSGNTDAVTVIENKKLHAVALGEARITIEAGGKTAEVTINVRPALESVSISNEAVLKAKWVIGDAARTVEVSFAPSDYYSSENTTVEITSSNEQAIIVSGKTLTAIGLGKSTITVTAGNKTAEIELEVVKPDLTRILIDNKTELTAKWAVGDATRTVEINYTPHNYYNDENTKVTVSSSNESVLTVDGKTLTATGVGSSTVTITYGTGNNALTDSVKITVVRPDLTSVSITNKDDFTDDWQMNSGTKTLDVTFDPAQYYSLADVEVVSSDNNIVSVNKTNEAVTLTAVSGGEATITVKVGSRQDRVTINVVRPPLTSLSITSEKTLNWTLDGSNSTTISVTFDPADYYNAVDVTVTASGGNIVMTDGLTITANGNVGTATITVAYKDDATIKDTITVTTTVSNPSIELSGNGVTLIQDGEKAGQYLINCLHGAAISLPTVNKAACDNRDDNITLDDLVLSDTEKMTLDNNKLTVSEKGEFTVTYTVKDGRDETKTASVVLNIAVYRNIIGSQGWAARYKLDEEKMFVADEQQVLLSTDANTSGVSFNVTPSKNYYAEVTFVSNDFFDGEWVSLGMAHYIPENAKQRSLVSFVGKGDKNFFVKDFEDGQWDFSESDSKVFYAYQLTNFRGITIGNTENKTVKYAIARIGDNFFTFIDDQYICCASPIDYRSLATVPGIFGSNFAKVQTTNISVVYDTQANTKVNTLLKGGSGIASIYRPYGDWGEGSTDKTNFTVNAATDERGANFDFNVNTKDYNNSMVSPYIYLDGDFTFEWEYKPTNVADGWENGMVFELRNRQYGDSIIKFGVQFNNAVNSWGTTWDGDPTGHPCNLKGVRFIADMREAGQNGHDWHQTNYYLADPTKYDGGARDEAVYANVMQYGVTLRVTRKIENGKATMVYSVVPYIDANKTEDTAHAYTVTYTDIDEQNYGAGWQDCTGVLQVVWHNQNAAGEYSNIRWAYTADYVWGE